MKYVDFGMNRGLVLAALAMLGAAVAHAELTPAGLRCEYRRNPLGIDETRPRLSWQLESGDPAARGLRQKAYQVLVASSREALDQDHGDLWDRERKGLVPAASEYPWSSARAHLRGRDEGLVQVTPLRELAPHWRRLLTSAVSEEEWKVLRGPEPTGRPLGDDDFLVRLEQNLGRVWRRRKPGRKRNPRRE